MSESLHNLFLAAQHRVTRTQDENLSPPGSNAAPDAATTPAAPLPAAAPNDGAYSDGFEVYYDGAMVGRIANQVGKGACGTVYKFVVEYSGTISRDCGDSTYDVDLEDGEKETSVDAESIRDSHPGDSSARSFATGAAVTVSYTYAAKQVTFDENASGENQLDKEKELAKEAVFGFAMGRSPFTATVIRAIVAGSLTNAKGLLLIQDFIDGGDLEEAMSTKESVKKLKPDYKGELWDEGAAATWPIASITLQIFNGFEHCHERGVFHQVSSIGSST